MVLGHVLVLLQIRSHAYVMSSSIMNHAYVIIIIAGTD